MVTETKHYKTGDPEPIFPNDGKLRLLSMRYSPYAQRTHIILEAKKIPYHTINIDLTNKPEWLTKYSPLGKVPVLGIPTENEYQYIHDSLVIADYLDEKYPEKLLYPEDPLAKALDRLLIERFHIVSSAYHKLAFKGDGEGLNETLNGLDEFEAELKKRDTPFFGGEKADISMGLDIKFATRDILHWWELNMGPDPAVNLHYVASYLHYKFVEGYVSKTPNYDMLVEP